MKERLVVLALWFFGSFLAVWVEVGCGWGTAGGGLVLLSGVVWWLLTVSRRRELGRMALLLVPLTGLAWTWTGYPGAGAMGLAVAAAVMPVKLVGERPWQPFAGSGFVVAVAAVVALLVEAVSGGRMPSTDPALPFSLLLSALGGGVLGAVLLSADGLLGLAGPKHLTSSFRLDVSGFRQRVRGIREEA